MVYYYLFELVDLNYVLLWISPKACAVSNINVFCSCGNQYEYSNDILPWILSYLNYQYCIQYNVWFNCAPSIPMLTNITNKVGINNFKIKNIATNMTPSRQIKSQNIHLINIGLTYLLPHAFIFIYKISKFSPFFPTLNTHLILFPFRKILFEYIHTAKRHF